MIGYKKSCGKANAGCMCVMLGSVNTCKRYKELLRMAVSQ